MCTSPHGSRPWTSSPLTTNTNWDQNQAYESPSPSCQPICKATCIRSVISILSRPSPSSVSALYVLGCSLGGGSDFPRRCALWLRHLVHVSHHLDPTLSLYLQPTGQRCEWTVPWPHGGCPGRDHGRHARRLLAGRSRVWPSLRQSRSQELHPD